MTTPFPSTTSGHREQDGKFWAALPPSADRAQVLEQLSRHLRDAWKSFEMPRPGEPEVDTALLQRLAAALPLGPGDASVALQDAVRILESSVSPSRPLFLAYIGSSGLEAGVLASALAAAYDANLATSAGAADVLDQQAVRWVAEFVGYPAGEGHFTSGGQISNLTALLAARERALPGAREDGVRDRRVAIYCSDEAHHSISRAVEIAGLGRRSLRRVPINERHRMQVAALRDQLAEDLESETMPLAVVATAGTTLTGAVDPLEEIADVCQEYGIWMHVDGAYGVPAAASRTAGHWFAGLERADSVTIDAHKWLGVQKSCSILLLRERGPLRTAFGHQERYMLHEEDTSNPVDHTLEYSRPFNSLRIWLAMRIHGAQQYQSWIDGTLANAFLLTQAVANSNDFELLHEPMLSTVCFRHVPAGMSRERLNAHNEHLARAMQRDGRVFLAPAVVEGQTCLRACFVNYRTSPEAVPLVLAVARELGEEAMRFPVP